MIALLKNKVFLKCLGESLVVFLLIGFSILLCMLCIALIVVGIGMIIINFPILLFSILILGIFIYHVWDNAVDCYNSKLNKEIDDEQI